MDFVRRQADEFVDYKLIAAENNKDFVDALKSEINNYYKTSDKLTFLEKCLRKIKEKRDAHLKVCKTPNNCWELRDLEYIIFFAEQELEKNGINHKDLFDSKEVSLMNDKLDGLISEIKVLKLDIEILKVGHQVIYDDFIEDFEKLKKQTYLDKRSWRQAFLGKFYEMTLSGIVSETISKKVVEIFGEESTVNSIKKLME